MFEKKRIKVKIMTMLKRRKKAGISFGEGYQIMIIRSFDILILRQNGLVLERTANGNIRDNVNYLLNSIPHEYEGEIIAECLNEIPATMLTNNKNWSAFADHVNSVLEGVA